MILLFAALAWADNALAVLPLGKGAASEQYDGLGKALSGMMVTDLAGVPGVQLVERGDLDALLGEIKLSETGFLDPKSAQKLGKGVGAEFVVTGSYSVVGDTFVMDARVVRVETAEIVKAADAQGTLTDFVSVEKELVEELVTGLDLSLSSADRRKLMLQTPTERFSALAAWGEGLARRDEGKLEAAKAAFEKALAEDPAFTEARAALDDLSSRVAATKAAAAEATKLAANEAYSKVLAAVPDERTRPDGFVDSAETLGPWVLRLGVLEDLGRECDRYAEMWHYLERNRFVVQEPKRASTDRGVSSYVAMLWAQEYGLDKANLEPGTPEYRRPAPYTRAAGLVRDLGSFIFNGHSRFKRTNGLLSSMGACHAPAARLGEIDKLLDGARRNGVAASLQRLPHEPLTLEDKLDLFWAETQAEHFGASAALSRRVDAVIARHKESEEGTRVVLRAVDDILRLAADWESYRVRTRGLGDAEIARRMDLIANGKLAKTEACARALPLQQGAIAWIPIYERYSQEEYFRVKQHVGGALMTWIYPADFGCFEGVKGRFKSGAEAWAYLDAAHARADDARAKAPECLQAWASFDQVLAGQRQWRDDPSISPAALFGVYVTWSNLVYYRCAAE